MRNEYVCFDLKKRQELEDLIKKRVSITRCAEAIGCNRTTIYNELQRGLTKEAYARREYDNYSAELAQQYSPSELKNALCSKKNKAAGKNKKATEDQLMLHM